VPAFARQFLNLPFSLIGVSVDIILEIYSLCFLVATRNLLSLALLTAALFLIVLIFFVLFRLFLHSTIEKYKQKN
jgi:hypothetical protein